MAATEYVRAGETAIDNGFILIPRAEAKRLGGGGPLPEPGKERLVNRDGRTWWLSRTWYGGQAHWSIRPAGGWRLVDGVAVL